MKKIPTISLAIFSVFVLLAFVFAFRFVLFGNYDKLDNAISASWLPEHATEIYSRNSGIFEVYEFTISEDEFLRWAKGKDLAVSPIEGETAKIVRYTYIDRAPGEFDAKSKECFEKYSETKLSNSQEAEVRACIDNASGMHVAYTGFFGEYRAPNYGGYTVIYDSELGRAFYQWNTH